MSVETNASEPRGPIPTGWYDADRCSLAELRAIVEVSTQLEAYPHADAVVENVLVYGAPSPRRPRVRTPGERCRPSWPGR